MCIVDDIVVFGTGTNLEEATRDHDEKMRNFLSRCKEKVVKLNKKKSGTEKI